MISIRRSADRGHFDHGWLDTYHTFSFADYHDPNHMGFRSLRVINEDRVAPGQGFGRHPHRNMEIITYVLSGELEHQDSMGNGAIIRPGEVQYMAAGTGVTHSEFNPSKTEPVHLMQIWIVPDRRGVNPKYEQRAFPGVTQAGKLTLVASGDGESGSIRINQDARMYAATLRAGQAVEDFELRARRGVWLQVLRGMIKINSNLISAGDGASVTEESRLAISAMDESEILLFDLS